jgi:hypothetical protein
MADKRALNAISFAVARFAIVIWVLNLLPAL